MTNIDDEVVRIITDDTFYDCDEFREMMNEVWIQVETKLDQLNKP